MSQKRSESGMGNIAILCTDETLNQEIQTCCLQFDDEFRSVLLGETESILEYLNYELPEISVLHASDGVIDFGRIIDEVTRDPWLHYGGFIVVHDDENERELMSLMRRVNIIAFIRRGAVSRYLPRVLRILRENRSFLYQRDIHFLLSSFHSGSFTVDNDPFDLNTYSNLITNFLYNSNLITFEQKDYFHVGMMELL